MVSRLVGTSGSTSWDESGRDRLHAGCSPVSAGCRPSIGKKVRPSAFSKQRRAPGVLGTLGVVSTVDARDLFDVPPEIAYFNTANLSPQLHRVRAAGVSPLRRRGPPWPIAAQAWLMEVERLRELLAGLVGPARDGVALVPA